ncbi:uncharacterized protein LAESUDRAFT_716593 [Laetiporus sulphureus 93-53]|uniref:Uncharacterized protein n=1 Tax=Laetiporus sulphureus 93-53 TaxID=1314785 RepID=A0A165CHA2_9APHY|nr:uncharacterized protein LAESUDRAFT_716593 [Laetiporus sulphureus 93-53]KZT02808.1 hypothetical protein LAESUDRAFT_716593 [Laetiporus sulphureus 93-53]
MERNWDGRGFVREGAYALDDSILHFRIDEKQQTALIAGRTGGLTVRALEDFRILYEFDKHYMNRRFELSHGFLVFPSRKRGIEIWRRMADIFSRSESRVNVKVVSTPLTESSPFAARDFQFAEAQRTGAQDVRFADLVTLDTPNHDLRGHYTPHAYLGAPFMSSIRMFRLSFPVLALMGSHDSNTLLLLDVCDGTLLQQISLSRLRFMGAPPDFRLTPDVDLVIMDIDISHDYVCVSLLNSLLLIRRRSEDSANPARSSADGGTADLALVLTERSPPQALQQLAMQLNTTKPSARWAHTSSVRHESYGKFEFVASADALERIAIVPPPESAQQATSLALVQTGHGMMQAGFIAGTAYGLLYLILDYARAVSGSKSLLDIARRVYIGDSLKDVIWGEQQRRIFVHTVSGEMYIINIDPAYHSLHVQEPTAGFLSADNTAADKDDLFAHIAVFHLADFSSRNIGSPASMRDASPSETQITRTGLWMMWELAMLESRQVQRDTAILAIKEPPRTVFRSVFWISLPNVENFILEDRSIPAYYFALCC